MGGKSSAPPPPAPIDAAQSAGRFLFGDDFAAGQGITDPQFQRRLLEAERTFGPEYVQNELSRQERALFGADGQTGLLGLYEQAAPVTERMRADTARRQREADIGDVERLGSRAVAAIREADPERARLIRQQQGLTDELYGRAQGVTPQQRRMAEQAAREAFGARGRDVCRGFGPGRVYATKPSRGNGSRPRALLNALSVRSRPNAGGLRPTGTINALQLPNRSERHGSR